MSAPDSIRDRTPPAARASIRVWAARLVVVLAVALALLRAEPAAAAGEPPAVAPETATAVLTARDGCTRTAGPRTDAGSDGAALALPDTRIAPERRDGGAAPAIAADVAAPSPRWLRLAARGPPRPAG